MPLRCAVFPVVASAAHPRRCPLHAPIAIAPTASPPRRQHRKPFHSSASLRDKQIDNSKNHYETLKLQPGATPAEIKKSFYALSKTHHPDHNPSNPNASRRFMRISEAYSVLSIPAKRAAYDRDTLQLQHHHHPSHRHGSYSSTNNPAGGRPASGLSRRRSAFQGPPPSFFRSGGWGSHGAKRRAAHEESTGTSSSSSSTSSTSTSTSTSSAGANNTGGMGPGQTPFGHGAEVPHFDRESHERTGRHSDRRRAARRAHVEGKQVGPDLERGTAGMFFVIGGVLVLSVLVPLAFSRIWSGASGGDGKQGAKGKKSSAI
ncbi:DnaJ-domain-containing protein [Hypoxylon sp. FL0543]|nr:DnaJ-domain-containing protein [Hypoxylon sp. FL0543]